MTPVVNNPSAGASVALPHGAIHPVPAARLHGVKGRPDMVAIGTLIWLANQRAVEFHVPNLCVDEPEPTGLVLDLVLSPVLLVAVASASAGSTASWSAT